MLHACVWSSAAQPVPPCCGATATSRVRVRVPPPHGCEHALNSAQSPTTQWMGHSLVLQLCCSPSAGHATPPNTAGAATSRVRDWCPPPHSETLHEPHAPQLDTAQSTGQLCTLQATLSTSAGHSVPP